MPRPDPPHMRDTRIRVSFSGPYPKLGRKKRPRRKGGGAELEPVEPNNPKRPLSGGAAAELEFDD
jgi:hypothetical protein